MSFEVRISVNNELKTFLYVTRKGSHEKLQKYSGEIKSHFGECSSEWNARIEANIENKLHAKKHPLHFLKDLLNAINIDDIVKEKEYEVLMNDLAKIMEIRENEGNSF